MLSLRVTATERVMLSPRMNGSERVDAQSVYWLNS